VSQVITAFTQAPPTAGSAQWLAMPLAPDCPGTVVVHRDLAVSCTAASCHYSVPRAYWFSLHSAFTRCGASGWTGESCDECGFGALGV